MRGMQFRLSGGPRLISVEDYRRAARRALPKMVWAYVDGGAEDHVTLRANRAAFDRWALRQRALAGHAERDLATEVAGVPLKLPILLAPTGLAGLTHWRGDIAAARAAEAAGTQYVLSTVSSWTIEEVAAAVGHPPFFQLYPMGERDLVASLMQRAWDAGCRVMMLTVDVPVRGNRESERRHGLGRPPVLTPLRMLDAATRPRWAYNFFRHQRVAARNFTEAGGTEAAIWSIERWERSMINTLDWDDAAWIRERWRGPMYIKGLLHADDAQRAVALGAEGVVVSNHGGRQLDGALASLDALPAIVDAVGDRAEVLVDGGIRRGSDVLKALSLGARAVLIGRPYVYGLAARGEAGVRAVLRIFEEEIELAMTLMGAASVRELDRSWVVPATTLPGPSPAR